jgi:hypothetical protein
MTRRVHSLLLAAVALLVFARPALAGPPLLCFPFDIGAAKSLPMGTKGWESVDPKYNVTRLVDDTLALLTPQTPIVERMETLRRATVYAAKNPKQAGLLIETLQARAAHADANAGLAVFDFGYLVETYKQAGWISSGATTRLVKDIDGYSLVEKALALTNAPAMNFALVAMSVDKTHGVDRLREHVAGARNAAKSDASVRINLASHWSEAIAQY